MNAAEQHRYLLEVGSFKHYKNMRVRDMIARAVKDDNGSKELVDLRNRNAFVKSGGGRQGGCRPCGVYHSVG